MRRIATALALIISAVLSEPASAQKLITPSASGSDPATATRRNFEDVRPAGSAIVLWASSGTLIRLPSAARTVFVADPEVADVQVQAADAIYVTGKKAGSTALYAADEAGNTLLSKVVEVKTGAVTIIRGGAALDAGQAEPGPIVLQIPLQPAAPAPKK